MFCLAVLIGLVLEYLSIPIPFLLGGIAAAMTFKIAGSDANWPFMWREIGLAVAGYGIGRNFSAATVHELTEQIFGVLSSSGIAVAASVVIALVTARLTYANLISCMMGCMPGGLTAMMLLAEEDKRTDFNIVMAMQTLRLTGVVIIVPFLVVHGLGAQVLNTPASQAMAEATHHWLWLLPIAGAGAVLASKVHLATPHLLGPILMTSACSYFWGNLGAVPSVVMLVAQVSIGLYMGMLLDPKRLKATGDLLPYIFGGIFAMIGVSVLMAYYLSKWYGFSLITGFLAMAPGGIAEMCLAGMSMGEDVSIILTYQLVRLIFLNVTVPVGIKYYFREKSGC